MIGNKTVEIQKLIEARLLQHLKRLRVRELRPQCRNNADTQAELAHRLKQAGAAGERDEFTRRIEIAERAAYVEEHKIDLVWHGY